MIHTILQILVFQLLFLAVYDLFLKKKTFFNLNRAYLLITPILSLVLPFISLGFIQQNIPQEYYVELPALMLGEDTSETAATSYSWLVILRNIWIAGMVLSGVVFGFKIWNIIKLKLSSTRQLIHGNRVVILPNTDTAFSFLNTIYLGEDISELNKSSIVAHEKVHIEQKHSLDLLLFEFLRIVLWFNPLVYLFQNRVSVLQEYIADAEVSSKNSKKEYYQNLLSEVFQTQDLSFINTFFKESLIKKRIIMLQKTKSPRGRMMKYLLLFPMLGAMLIYSSCSDTLDIPQETEQVSIDPLAPPMPPPPPPLPPPPPPPPGNKEFQYEDIPFAVIDKTPTYPGCSGDNEAMKTCMSTKISEFMNDNFNTKIAEDLNLSGRQRIVVQFKIDKTGKVVDVRARAPRPELEAEAIRAVEMLPQMTPGEQNGERVGVLYSLPIIFELK